VYNGKAFIILNISIALFGLSSVIARYLSIDSFSIVCGRSFFATIALYIALKYTSKNYKITSLLNKNIICSSVILALHWLSFFASVYEAGVSIGLLSFSTFPIFSIGIHSIKYKKLPSIWDGVVFSISFLGIYLISYQNINSNIMMGIVLGLISAILFAALQEINKTLITANSAIEIAFNQNLIVAILSLPFIEFSAKLLNYQTILGLILMGFACTACAHTLYISTLSKLPERVVNFSVLLEPVYAIVLASILLRETIKPNVAIGGMCIILSVIISVNLKMKNRII
jgi:drug/metabolite transporter (DMT)-like permease